MYGFTNQPARAGGAVYAVYADLGYNNSVSIPQLAAEVQAGAFDMIIHAGDVSGGGRGSCTHSLRRCPCPHLLLNCSMLTISRHGGLIVAAFFIC